MTRRFHDRLTVAAFLAAIVLPALCQLAGWDLPSAPEDEKRKPADFPSWPATAEAVRQFPRGVDKWFQDHFGLRQLLIRGHAALLYHGLHTAPQDKVILGRDGWIFYDGAKGSDGDPVADARGTDPISPYVLEKWRWTLQDLRDWFAARGKPFYIAFIPAKETVYPEYTPDWMKPVANAAAIDDLCRYMHAKSDIPVLNLRPVLLAAKGAERLYLKTDTHWNDLGAYHGYRAIMELLSRQDPRLRPAPAEDFIVEKKWGTGGDLAGMAGLRRLVPQEYTFLKPRQPRRATVQVLTEQEQSDSASVHPDSTLPRALVLRDSFTQALTPFLAEHFAEAYYRWPVHSVDYATLSRTNMDLVIGIFGDRHLRQPFKYPSRIQEEQSRARFAAAAPHFRITADDLATREHGESLTVARTPDGVLLRSGRGDEGWISLPAVTNARTRLPLVAIELTARRAGDVYLQWRGTGTQADETSRENRVSVPAAAGRSTVCLPLLDPQMTGPVRFGFARSAGPVTLHGVEVRSIPR